MAYIGKQPTIGNFQVCDAISVVNNQAAYTMQVGGVNVSPESSQHMLVSLNGVIQKNGGTNPSFTVSGSTITFASNLVTGDVIDFIQILGNVLDLGVPSDSTVSLAKLTATGTKDATTFLRGDNTFDTPSSNYVKLVDTSASNASSVDINGFFTSDYDTYILYLHGVYNQTTSGNAVYARLKTGGSTITSSTYQVATKGRYAESGNQGDLNWDEWNTDSIRLTYNSGNTLATSGFIQITFSNPLDTSTPKKIIWSETGNMNTTQFEYIGGGAQNTGTAALSGINIYGNSQNINIQKILLYGVRS